jgi:hypothetical protein
MTTGSAMGVGRTLTTHALTAVEQCVDDLAVLVDGPVGVAPDR